MPRTNVIPDFGDTEWSVTLVLNNIKAISHRSNKRQEYEISGKRYKRRSWHFFKSSPQLIKDLSHHYRRRRHRQQHHQCNIRVYIYFEFVMQCHCYCACDYCAVDCSLSAALATNSINAYLLTYLKSTTKTTLRLHRRPKQVIMW